MYIHMYMYIHTLLLHFCYMFAIFLLYFATSCYIFDLTVARSCRFAIASWHLACASHVEDGLVMGDCCHGHWGHTVLLPRIKPRAI